jgi:23S rRNA pseudouridine2605 synthase
MPGPKVSLARALSKLGYCSRVQAFQFIHSGKVKVNEHAVKNPARRIDLKYDRITVDGNPVIKAENCYLILNKPRGLITTSSDEQKRDTVYKCLDQTHLPRLIAVGRLDKASEGLLLFTNDTAWANRIANPVSHLDKVYHVQIKGAMDFQLLQSMSAGVETVKGEILQVKQVKILRKAKHTSWLKIVLDEGRNRQIRRILEALNITILRLIRVAIGPLQLGKLAKGEYRLLKVEELAELQNAIRAKN